MKEITVIQGSRSPHQKQHAEAIIKGFTKIGVKCHVKHSHTSVHTKNVTTWGWRGGKELYEKGHNVLVMERGYVGDRFKHTSLGWNGLNGHANFPKYEDDDGARFKKHGGVIKPWRDGGDYILILGQVINDASLQGKDLSSWYRNKAEEASKFYSLPVYFRPHPESVRRGGYTSIEGFKNINGTLQESLDGAKFTIAFNSNSCLDSILNGTPCYAGDMGTVAWDMCMYDIQDNYKPEREIFCHQIAWKQWTLEEIATGFSLIKLMETM